MNNTEGNRRAIGLALFGSSLLMAVGAALVGTGTFAVAETSRVLIAGVLGVVAVLDALAGVYFVVTSHP